jgi:uncharacterized protein (TIGR02118 family)
VVKLVYVLYRKPGMSREEFQRYWRYEHGPGVPQAKGVMHFKRYVQVHTIDTPVDLQWRIGRSQEDVPDGVAEAWWEDLETMEKAMATPEGQAGMFATLLDEANFIDPQRSVIFVAEEVDFPLDSPDG